MPGFQAYTQGVVTVRDEYNKFVVPIGRTIALVLYGISYVFYICTIAKIIFMRLQHQSSNSNFIKWHEVSLFIQAFIICGYKTGMTLLKNYTDFADPNNKTLYFIFWCVNYFEIGYNAWLYIAFNKKLRREIRALFSSKTTVSSIQVKPTQAHRTLR
uniref:Very-long-chain 3-oxoacyl-CoA synthase n=1 Tax=Acrobeloides nanus TaxID=290746 RepID=A0A914EKP8_9BILA